ncbi:zinc finger protein 436 isoform X1 [Ixodes scapularis]
MKALKAWRRTICVCVRPTLPTRAAATQSRGSPGNTKLEQLGTTVLDSSVPDLAAFEGEWESTVCEGTRSIACQVSGFEWRQQEVHSGRGTDGGATSVVAPTAAETPPDGATTDPIIKEEAPGYEDGESNAPPQVDADVPAVQWSRRPGQLTTHRCSLCPYSSRYTTALACHERTHTGKKPFSCHYCKKLFKQVNHLRVHERIHTGEKPFRCETCQQSFTQSTHLLHHQRMHTDERPFVCSECGSAFRWKDNLRVHRRTHTGERPYTCETCGRGYADRRSLIGHRKRWHK